MKMPPARAPRAIPFPGEDRVSLKKLARFR